MSSGSRHIAVWAAVFALFLSACSEDKSSPTPGPRAKVSVTGAGSTLAAPIYQQWANALSDRGVILNFQPTRSGAGLAQLGAGRVDFAASDPPLGRGDRLRLTRGAAVQVPVGVAAITIAYNLPRSGARLRLDGAALARIFAGKITSWDDPAIAKLNPGAQLPRARIAVVHRSDRSGTTAGFTSFLAAHSKAWRRSIGGGEAVGWPVGSGAKGNDAVAAAVRRRRGAIGYVGQAQARQNNLATASVRNSAGRFVQPTQQTTAAAAEGVKIRSDGGFSTLDSPRSDAYPISSQTFLVVYRDLCKAGLEQPTARALKALIDYGLGGGQNVLSQLQYAKLSPDLLARARAASDSLTCNGARLKR